MLLVLDVDYTLNCFYPPSVHDLAPPELLEQEGPALWAWLVEHLSTVEYPVREQAVEVLGWLNACAPKVVVSTGRPEALRVVTECWLRRFFHFERLFMRQPQDSRSNAEIKRDALIHHLLPLADECRVYAFEDDAAALDMYRQHGVRTFAAPACWPELHTWLRNNPQPASVQDLLGDGAGQTSAPA